MGTVSLPGVAGVAVSPWPCPLTATAPPMPHTGAQPPSSARCRPLLPPPGREAPAARGAAGGARPGAGEGAPSP